MQSIFVKEQKRYTQSELQYLFDSSEEGVVPIIRKLKEFGILKTVRYSYTQKDLSELQEEEIEVTDVEAGENDFYYVFTFVGVVVVSGRVLKCYPKYLMQKDQPLEELRQILKVLEKYNSKEQIVQIFNESSEGSSFNLLAVLLFILLDYFENGAYTNTMEVIESNGSGEILWDKTINETFAIISENRPYYVELQTSIRRHEELDFVIYT